MGTRVVLENIRYFIQTLIPRAETGSPWTETDLTSALGWADFCQAAAVSAPGCPAERVLVDFVRVVARGRSDLDVALLQQARRALLSRLLQNPRVGDAVLRTALAALRLSGELETVVAELARCKQAYRERTDADGELDELL
ncbi:uncharacterized protein LOC119092499 [Pollicipes pollicipes]|uniref:uncharacterized protein LOC119092499 n=1 Tax=Pollicipes pollicipes TaxID=41117 RepID=UPI0018858AB7|nr:uncharacterized protein LOC119092499 [Pollicipes pollicipes]